MGSLFRFMNPAISHDSVNFQRALGWHVHSLTITKIIQKLLCGEARVRGTPKGKRFPQEDSKRPPVDMNNHDQDQYLSFQPKIAKYDLKGQKKLQI